MRREAEEGNLIECEYCGTVIRNVYGEWEVGGYYDFNGETICEDCLIDYSNEFYKGVN